MWCRAPKDWRWHERLRGWRCSDGPEADIPHLGRSERDVTTSHVVRPLTPETYPAWLALAQKHNGVWGGCWCSYFHGDTEGTVKKEHDGPTFKAAARGGGRRPRARSSSTATTRSPGASTAAPLELPNIYHRKQYDAGETRPAPWRITCFFVDRDHRRSGVAREALDGALELIAQAGGGEVVSFPNELVPGQEDLVLVPAQRHAGDVREGWVHVRASHRQAQDRHAQDRPAGQRVSRRSTPTA